MLVVGAGSLLRLRVKTRASRFITFRNRAKFAIHERSRNTTNICRPEVAIIITSPGIVGSRKLRELRNNLVEPGTANNLHHVIVKTILLSNTKDRHDVGMVKLGGSLCLAPESTQMLFVEQR